MQTHLLKTKLYIPAVHADLVVRPRLFTQLDRALHKGHKLTLISAPAGFGKTTLVTTWLAQSRYGDRVAWLSLDAGDDALARFLTYVVAALQTVDENIGHTVLAMLQSPQLPPTEMLVTHLINDLAQTSMPLILVLDDYHVIKTAEILTALAFLLEHAPPPLHLVITSRTDPLLPLPLLRGRRQMTEIRAVDLRFTDEEANTLFNQVLALALSADAISALEKRTEGWITGLQLVAHSLQGDVDATAFVRDFAGSNRYVLDYLLEEVLHRQPEDIQRFLLQTAVLERMTGALCEAVTGQPEGVTMLNHLERANLFLVPLDEDRQWYRYHHLFADLLRHQLEVLGSHLECAHASVLHQRASVWYKNNGYLDEAIQHAAAAEDFDRVADLIEDAAMPLLARGELSHIMTWIEMLPRPLSQTRPWVCLYLAWIHLLNGHWDLAVPALQQVEHLAQNDAHTQERDSLMGHANSIRAYRALEEMDLAGTIDYAEQAQQLLPQTFHIVHSILAFTLGNAYRFNSDLTRAAKAYAQAIALGKSAEAAHILAPSASALGRLQVRYGHLHLAEQTYRETLDLLADPKGHLSPVTAGVCSRLGDLYYEWNDLETALTYLHRGVELGRAWMNVGLLVSNLGSLSQALRVSGDAAGADAALQEADTLCQTHSIHPRIGNLQVAHYGRLHVMRQDHESAARWIVDNALHVDDALSYARDETYVALVRVLTLLGRYDEAAGLAVRLLQMTERDGCTGNVIAIKACQGLILWKQDAQDGALATLSDALRLAEPEGYVRTFVDHGAPMATLLKQVVLHSTAQTYVNKAYIYKLLSAFKDDGNKATPDQTQTTLVEPLTERELEVLRLVAAGLNNTEIASTLYVALSTIKKHINHLYSKLDVRHRTAAVARAQELGLL